MAGFEVKIDKADILSAQNMLAGVKNGFPKAMSRALNKGLESSRVESRRKIQAIITANTKYTNKALFTDKATPAKLTAKLSASKATLPLTAFQYSVRKDGVSVKILKTGGRKFFKHAFVATMKNKSKIGEITEHKGIFWRVKNIRGTSRVPLPWMGADKAKFKPMRLKIKQIKGVSIDGIFNSNDVVGIVSKLASNVASNELARQVDLLLK